MTRTIYFRHGQHGQDIVYGSKRSYKLYKRVDLDDAEVVNCKLSPPVLVFDSCEECSLTSYDLSQSTAPESEVKKYTADIENLSSDVQILQEMEARLQQLHTSHEVGRLKPIALELER